jgi:hypothetical protein
MMARFHFHLFNDDDVWDEEGQELPDLAAAEAEAVRAARDVIAHHVLSGRPICLDHRMEIMDDRGTVLRIVYFSQAVTFRT